MRFIKFISLYQLTHKQAEDKVNEEFEKINQIGYVEKTEYTKNREGHVHTIIVEYEGSKRV